MQKLWSPFLCILLLLATASTSAKIDQKNIQLIFRWTHAELLHNPVLSKSRESPKYIPENNIIYGVSRDVQNNVMYASIPRSAPGVPATLVFIRNVSQNSENSPKFEPFPSLEMNDFRGCAKKEKGRKKPTIRIDYSFDERFDGREIQKLRMNQCKLEDRLISTFQPVTDSCGRLWVIDTGVLDHTPKIWTFKRPQLWCFDVSQGPDKPKILRRFDFPRQIITKGQGLTGMALDIVDGKCENTFVYIPNQLDDRIVVYDFYNDDSWYFENWSFSGDHTESDFEYEGFQSHFEAGVASVALGRRERGRENYRTLYYTAGGSTGEYSISTKELRNRSRSPDISNVSLVGFRGHNSQSFAHVFDEINSVLFFAEAQTGCLRCWNIRKPMRPENVVTVFQSRSFVFGSHIFIDSRRNLWFMSNRFPLFKAGIWNPERFNIRLYSAVIEDLIEGTECEKPKTYIKLTKENIRKYLNINLTEVITDDLL